MWKSSQKILLIKYVILKREVRSLLPPVDGALSLTNVISQITHFFCYDK